MPVRLVVWLTPHNELEASGRMPDPLIGSSFSSMREELMKDGQVDPWQERESSISSLEEPQRGGGASRVGNDWLPRARSNGWVC